MATTNLGDTITHDPADAEHVSTAVPAFVTAAELKRPLTRPCSFGRTGTLRLETGALAFEGSDGKRLLEASLDRVSDVVPHRSGYAFWARLAGKRYFVTPRHKPRPFRLGDLLSLGITIAVKTVYWDIRERRRAKALVRAWIDLLSAGNAVARPHGEARGLPVRIGRVVWSIGFCAWIAVLSLTVLAA
jgi:hypothetical protein